MRTAQDDISELAACNFSHQRTASPELVMRSLKHVTPDATYWLAPDPRHPCLNRLDALRNIRDRIRSPFRPSLWSLFDSTLRPMKGLTPPDLFVHVPHDYFLSEKPYFFLYRVVIARNCYFNTQQRKLGIN